MEKELDRLTSCRRSNRSSEVENLKTWQLQVAKNRLSEVVDRAIDQGPQVITRRGSEAVVVLAIEEYRRLRPKSDLIEFFRTSPLAEVELDLERSKDPGRELDL